MSKSLTPSGFVSEYPHYLKDKSCALVFYMAPWCPHCVAAKPKMEKFAKGVKSVLNVYSFDCEKYKGHVEKIQRSVPGFINGYPTFWIYKGGKPIKEYQGQLDLQKLLNMCQRVCA